MFDTFINSHFFRLSLYCFHRY